MICPPCAKAADEPAPEFAHANAARADHSLPPLTVPHHDPTICRDQAIQPHGCACQHGQDGPSAQAAR
jgi:hypothetical protein